MAKGFYSYLRKMWKKPDKVTLRERMIEWRASNALEEVKKPLRLDRARALGYKAKKGFFVVRARLVGSWWKEEVKTRSWKNVKKATREKDIENVL